MLKYEKYQSSSDAKQLIFLLHGYGSNKDDLISIAPELSKYLPHAVFISPNAPELLEMSDGYGGAYQWFSLSDRSEPAMLAGAKRASATLEQFVILQASNYKLTINDVAFIGFSQGSMMSMHLGLRMKEQIRGIVAYSGLLISPRELSQEITAKPPVMLIHGSEDQVVPITQMNVAKRFLVQNGVTAYTHECARLGHGIDTSGIEAGGLFLRDIFA